MKHARTATQGGQPLFDQQIVQLKINKMNMLTEALRSFVMRIAWEHDHKVHSANAGLAMNFSTDVIQEVTELNLEIHGGAGGTRRPPRREAGARRLHLEPSRRRQRAAAQGRTEIDAIRCVGAALVAAPFRATTRVAPTQLTARRTNRFSSAIFRP